MSKVILIASVCHALNAALCRAIGDDSQPAWANAPEWQRASAVAGVEMHLANPNATPEQSHESWMAQKTAEGWAYGEVKDPEKKLHPCFRPYAELPEIQRAKDHVFKACVHALDALPLDQLLAIEASNVPAPAPAPAAFMAALAGTSAPPIPLSLVQPVNGMIPVRYIGKRETYRDGTYGTNIVFAQGETRMVAADKARQMLKHRDVYEPGVLTLPQQVAESMVGASADPTEADQKKQDEQVQEVRDSLNAMREKAAIADFVKQHFNQDLDRRSSLADLKAKALQLVDQFGIGS